MITSAVSSHMRCIPSVEDVAHLMLYIGPNMLLTKMDIKQAYRLILMCPQDCIFQRI